MSAYRKTLIIGGGAAGFFAAINLKALCPDMEVTILEKSQKLLSKVRISGGGRCNVTHACFDPAELISNYPRGEKELLGPFHRFMCGDLIAWFDERGIELKIEEDGRMFPTTNRSETIVQCFLDEAKRLGVVIKLGVDIQSLDRNHDQWILQDRLGNNFRSDVVMVASGGHPSMKHYQSLASLGHQIKSPIPSLFTFNLPNEAIRKLMGLSKEVEVNIIGSKWKESGPLLITHWGMSGPAILKLSSKAAPFLNERNYQFDFNVNWVQLGVEEVFEAFLNLKKEHPNKSLGNAKWSDFPMRLWEYLIQRAGLVTSKKLGALKNEQLKAFAQVLSRDTYRASGKTTFKEEFVTCGGVDLKEVDFRSMQSKIAPQLYFAGEVLNIDALTGGFNFQSAWTTAWIAAHHIAEQAKPKADQ